MPSKTQICNDALTELKDLLITSIDDDIPQARYLKAVWDTVRDRLLERYPWNFAMKRATLSRLATEPDFEYDYMYALPTDCISVWNVYDSDSNYVIESSNLLIDDDTVELKYIARITDVSKYPPAFARCLALALADRVALQLGKTLNDKNNLKIALKEEIGHAEVLNAIEGKPYKDKDEQPLDSGNFSWQTEGR